jgi:cellulose biosynthesis protein BcsQ
MPALWEGQRILSIANLKGGVGKSTTAMMLADTFSLHHRLRVLLLDLDAQGNASRMLLGNKALEEHSSAGRTLTRWVNSISMRGSNELFRFLIPGASGLSELRNPQPLGPRLGSVDLLAASPELRFAELDFDHRRHDGENKHAPRVAMAAELQDGISTLGTGIDLVIFDCPPGFTTLAQAALSISDAIISPLHVELLSLWSVQAFRRHGLVETLNIWRPEAHRILYTRVKRQGATEQKAILRKRARDDGFQPFSTDIKDVSHAHKWTHRPAFDSYETFSRKYGPVAGDVKKLGTEAAEFIKSATPTAEI